MHSYIKSALIQAFLIISKAELEIKRSSSIGTTSCPVCAHRLIGLEEQRSRKNACIRNRLGSCAMPAAVAGVFSHCDCQSRSADQFTGYTPEPRRSMALATASPKSLRKDLCFPVPEDGNEPTINSPLHIPINFWRAGIISARNVLL
jgi:hypothetical protein